MITKGLLIALITAHLKAYKENYITIITSFVSTYTIKKLIKILDADIADAFALGGYAMTVSLIIKFLAILRTPTSMGKPEVGHEIIGGAVGDLIEKFTNH